MTDYREIRDKLRRLEEGRAEVLTDACTSMLKAVGVFTDDAFETRLYEFFVEHTPCQKDQKGRIAAV